MFTQAPKQSENGKAAAEQKKVQQKEQNALTLSRHQSPFPGSIQRKKSPANGNWSIGSRSSFPGRMQAKVKIGEPNDKFEKEADSIADKVMSMPAKTQAISTGEKPGAVSRKPETSLLSKITPLTQKKEEVQNKEEEEVQEKSLTSIQTKSVDGAAETPLSTAQRLCSDCSSNEGVQSMLQPMADEAQTQNLQSQIYSVSTPNIQTESTSETSRGPPDSFESSLNSSKGGGSPLPDETQREMGSGFGADFSNVRVHTDSNAVRMNQQIGAQAFTYGRDIYFNEGKYSPGTDTGKHLLAHELTHTVQQGAVLRPYRAQMKAEETGPIVQRAGPDPLAVDKEEIDKDKGVEKAVQARAPPGLHTAPVMVQGGWLGDKLNEYASDIPGWTLITVVVGYNPLTERDVERTPKNFLKGLMGLVPGGNALYEKLEEHNLITEAFNWLNQQLSDLDLSWRRVAREMEEAWDEMSIGYSFSTNLGIVKDHLYTIYRDVKEFGKRIINKTIELVKQAILIPLAEYIRDNTRAWPLVTVLLGEDPITGEKVERNLYNIASGFLMLNPDGEAYLNKLNESGKLQELSDWFDDEVEKLNVNADTITQVFSDAWDLITLDNLLEPLDTFKKIFDLFFGPFERIINFVIAVAMKILTAIKDWLIAQLKEHAHKVPGYPLLTVILGKDPVTQEEVPRTAENFIKGFMSFVPGGLEKFENLKKSGAIDKAFTWLEKAVAKLNLSFEAFLQLFIDLWESFTINDLLDPIGAFEKIINIFSAPVLRIIDFAIEVGLKVLEFIFTGVMGETGARVVNIIKKSRSTFMKVIKNPVGFFGNLLQALVKGFKQFGSNILQHLLSGLAGWLFGALEGAGLTLPEKWDFKGIVSLVMQVLGLTWDRMRKKLVDRLGERTVARLETAFEFVKILATEGIAGVWQKIMEYMSGLKDKIFEGIRNWVITKIVTIAIEKLATMWNPVGAVIQSIIAIYNTIMFFIERLNQILDLVEAVIDSITNIANGKLEDAANYVEQAMAKTLPVIISFLARLIGLGGISEAIKGVIKKVQETVDKGIDKVLDWIVKQVKKLIDKGKAGLDKLMWWKAKKDFTNTAGENHKLYFTGQGKSAKLMMASTPVLFSDYIKQIKPSTPEDKTAHANALKYAKEIDDLKQKTSTNNNSSGDSVKDATPEFNDLLDKLSKEVVKISSSGGPVPQSSKFNFGGITARNYGTSATVDMLTKIAPPGSEPSVDSTYWSNIVKRKEGGRSMYVRGHLLNGQLGGPGTHWANLTPITQDYNNTDGNSMLHKFETPVKKEVDNDKAVDFRVTVTYGRPKPGVLSKIESGDISSIDNILSSFPGQLNHLDSDVDKYDYVHLVNKIAIEEQYIPKSLSLQAWSYDPNAGNYNKGSNANGTKVGTAPIPKNLDITTDNFSDYQTDKKPKPAPAQIDNYNKMIENKISTNTAGKIRAATQRINSNKKAVKLISQLQNESPGIKNKVIELFDEKLIKLQPSLPAEYQSTSPKLTSPTSSWSSNPAEQQADSMADRIVTGNTSTPLASSITPTAGKVHKKCATCEQEEKSDSNSFESQLNSSSGGGRKLDKNTQTEMESGFGADFSGVKVHTGQNAAQMSQSIGARAFTHGNDIYFNSGQYNPESREGKHLLAHELTHTVQQGAAKPKVQAQRGPPSRGSPCTQCKIQAKEQSTGSAVQSRAGTVEVRESTSPDAVQRWSFGGLVRGAGRLVSSGVRAVGNAASAVAEGVMDMGRDALFAIIRRVVPDFLPLIQGGGITSFIRRLLNSAFSTLTNGFIQSLSAANAMGASIQERFAGAVATFTEIIGQLRNNDCSGVFALGSSIGSFFSSTLQPVFTAIRSIAEPIKNVFDSMFEVVAAPVMDFLRTIGGAAWESITGFISTIGDMFRSVKGALGSAWTRVKGWLGIEADEGTSEGGGLWEWVKGKATKVWNSITSALEPVMGPLRVVGGILLILSPAGPAILLWQAWPHLRDAWNWLSEMWGNLDLIGRSHQLLTQSILPPIMSALNTVGGALQSAAGWLGGILNRALSGVQQLMNALGAGGIFGFIRRAINVIVSKFESLVNGFNQFIQTAVSKAVELFNAAVAFLRPIFNVLVRVAAVVLNPFGISGLLLGGLWYLTPDCLKGPLINFLLDIMIGFLEILPPLPMLGILWPFVKTLTLGYLRRMREFDTDRQVRLTNKIALILAGQSPSFFLGFLAGIAMGVWEGVTGPFMMIADLFQLPGLIMGFVRQIQEYLGGLWEEAAEIFAAARENASTTVDSIISGARDLLADPAKIISLISTAIQTALGAVESLGRSAADQVIGIFEQDDSALGQALGSLIGQMLFDAVVSFFTAGGAAAGAAAARVTRILQQFARRIMPIIRRLMQFFPRITSFIQRLIGMFRRVGSAVGRMLERFDSFIERIEDRFRGLLRRGDDIDLPNRRHAPDIDGPDLPNRRRSPDIDGPDVDAPSHRRRPDTDVDVPDRPRNRTSDSDVDAPDRHRDRSPDADTDAPDRRRNQDYDTDTDRPADHNDTDERRRRRDEDDDDDPGWLEIRTAIRTAVVRFELSGGSRREIDTALDGAQRRYPHSRITVRPDLNDPYWVISAMHPTLHVPRTAEEVLLDRDTRWRMGGIEVRTRMSRLTEAQKNVAAINAILTPIMREYHYSRLHAENDQREGDINIMGSMSPEQQITEVEGSLDGKWREYETMFRREISEVGNDGASEEEIRGKIRTVENREEFNPLNISTTYRSSADGAKRTISTMSPEKATYRESAEIWQSQTERKNAAQSFFNSEKRGVTNSQYTNTHMNGIARSIETRFNFNRVNVNHNPNPTDSWAFMIQTPAHTLGEIEDIRGLHRGSAEDPIPILWYKPPGAYPLSVVTTAGVFSRSSAMQLPLVDRRNNSVIENIRIGFDTSNIVETGDIVHKVSSARSGVPQDRYRRVLEQHGYDMSALSLDADHILDLGFSGADSYNNLWPLDSTINRRGFNSFPWVRIVLLDRQRKAVERQMMQMSTKYFKIIGHGINSGLVGRDPV